MGTRFEIEGRMYDYDGKITVEDALFIHEKSGLGMAKFQTELLVELNPAAVGAWMYILKRRAGEAVRWQDVLKLDMRTFTIHVEDDKDDAEVEAATNGDKPAKAAAKPDPTKRGTTRKSATTAT